MRRDLYRSLLEWKNAVHRKPLVLSGARQTGKTFLLNHFGEHEYERVVACNFEEEPRLDSLFRDSLDPVRILRNLETFRGQDIRPGSDLIVLDEIQASNAALASLKYLNEKAPEYHVACAGSLLGVKLSRPGSFPVGNVALERLHPLTFYEFLDALGDDRYRQQLEELDAIESLPSALHDELVERLRQYYFVGGMPEVVAHYVETRDPRSARDLQLDLLRTYELDFAKHAPATELPKLSSVWESVPKHLARENRRFVFSAVKPGARAREYENALKWLDDTGLIMRARAVETCRKPLAHHAGAGSFKVYALDVGLLGAMLRSSPRLMVDGTRLFDDFAGAFVESYAAQQLHAIGEPLYYWRSKGGKAELDFLWETDDAIVPLEVKAGINPKSKSLRSYDAQHRPPFLSRTNLLNLKRDGSILNVPLYALASLRRLAEYM